MKAVREYLYEKFADETDPIYDMGIGSRARYDNLQIGDIVQVMIDFDPPDFPKKGDYLLITNVMKYWNHDSPDIDKRINQKTFKSKQNLLKDNESYNTTQNWGWSYEFFKECLKYVGTIADLKKSVNEKFSAESDPITDMEIGAIHEIKKWLSNEFGENRVKEYFVVNPNGIIDVKNSVYFEHVSTFPEYIQFGKVEWDFTIKDSPDFTSLRGLPKYVGNDITLKFIGISVTEEEVRDICEVKAGVILTDLKRHQILKSREKYKKHIYRK